MPETSVCYRLSHCPAEGAHHCPGCPAQSRPARSGAPPRVRLAEDAVMAMATSITFATIFIALSVWLA
jgi:hypothetical protein